MKKIFRHKKVIILTLVMVIITFLIAGSSILLLYNHAQKDVYNRLTDIVLREKSFTLSLLKDNTISENHIIEHLKNNITLGHYGEIVYAKEIKDSIEFIITSKQSIQNLKIANSIPHATTMRKALKKETGYAKAIDYNGIEVYAAYTFVEKLNWGIVAKIPTSEINKPYVTVIFIVLILAVILISISTYILLRITNPIIDTLQKDEKELIAAKEKAEEINQKLQTIIHDFPNGSITMLDRNQIIQITGGNEYQKYNLNHKTFINKHISQLLSPEIYEINRPYILQALNGESSNYLVEFNGFYYMNYLFPIRNNHKETEFVLLMSNNITELKKTEQELIKAKEKAEESEQMFANMTKNVPCVVYQLRVKADGSTYFNFISEKASELFEFSVDTNSAQWDLGSQIPDEDKDAFMNSVIKAITENIPWHYEGKILTGSGAIKWFRGKSIPTMIGNEVVFNGIMEDISERKISEQELIAAKEKAEESEERLQQANEEYRRSNHLLEESQSIAKLGGWEFDIVNDVLYWTDETYRIHDTSPEEFNPTVDAGVSYFLPESKIKITEALELAITKGIGYDLYLETYTTKGRKIDVRTTCIVTSSAGKSIKLTGIFQDITEQKALENLLIKAKVRAEESEEKLIESNEFNRNLIDTMQDGFSVIDAQGVQTDANPAFCKMVGFTIEELRGATAPFLYWPPEEYENIGKAFLQTIKLEVNNFELVFMKKTGERFPVIVSPSPIRNKQGAIINYGAVIEDITERKQAEQALKDSEEQLKLVLKGSNLGFWDWNIETGKVQRNERWAEMLGFTLEEIEFTVNQWTDLIYPDDREKVLLSLNNLLEGKTSTHQVEYRMLTKGHGWKWIFDSANIVKRDSNGKPCRMTGTHSDITERKQADIQLQQYANDLKKLNADKDRFIKILAHDLKNPFNSLLGFSDLLVKNIYKYDKEKIETQLKTINQTIHKTYHLLEDILQWTNSQSGNLEIEPRLINLNKICNEQIEHIRNHADTKQIAVNYFETENIQLYADTNILKTILRNLIINAVKFTSTNGQIAVYAEKADKYAIITVSDNGNGISEENISKLWSITERITTEGTDGEKGTGFGLLLCKEFVEKHGGQIWVESEVGKGSDFKFTLPLRND